MHAFVKQVSVIGVPHNSAEMYNAHFNIQINIYTIINILCHVIWNKNNQTDEINTYHQYKATNINTNMCPSVYDSKVYKY